MESNITGNTLGLPIYSSDSDRSISSIGLEIEVKTEVFYEPSVEHLHTVSLGDLDRYYDVNYDIGITTATDDELYRIEEDGRKVFRSEHQAKTMLDCLKPEPGMRLLEYGCGKGLTAKRLLRLKEGLDVHLFDVSSNYVEFWDEMLPREKQACYGINPEWRSYFDIVASFFVFEHVEYPLKVLNQINDLLKPGGSIYILVPSVIDNPADFVVADHLQHFSEKSLRYVLEATGFSVELISRSLHSAGLIAIAKKGEGGVFKERSSSSIEFGVKVKELSQFWTNFQKRVRKFEEGVKGKKFAIYGAGFYGSYIYTSLASSRDFAGFIDRDEGLHGKEKFGAPIMAAEVLPEDVEVVYVALNPGIANNAIAEVSAWRGRNIKYFYL